MSYPPTTFAEADTKENWQAFFNAVALFRKWIIRASKLPHEFKIAAMNKAIAFPADPWFQAGDPCLLLALFLIILGLTNSLRWAKRPAN